MPNEMRRPCKPKDWEFVIDPFDATQVVGISSELHSDYLDTMECVIKIKINGAESAYRICHVSERYPIILEAITTIAEALNAPVLATEEVLAGLPKDAEALVFTGTYTSIPYNLYWGRHRYSFGKDEVWFFDGFNTNFKNCRIQAKNDPKTAEYLRQFTLDGVRIKEKETSND